MLIEIKGRCGGYIDKYLLIEVDSIMLISSYFIYLLNGVLVDNISKEDIDRIINLKRSLERDKKINSILE